MAHLLLLLLLDDVANIRINYRRRDRVFRDRQDLLANDDEWLMSRFRLPRAVLLDICAELGPALQRRTRRNRALSVPLQVLTTLGFLATGSYQREMADRSGFSQSAFSRILTAVVGGIMGMTHRYIRFPYTVAEQANIKRQFEAMSGFPNVIGAIDCTHVAIRAPTANEVAFINRKHYHSINVQLICDVDMVLTNVVARWPGSTHDSFIWRNSSVGRALEAGAVRDGWLLGDSGYPLKGWLLTPFPNPQSAEERTYNLRHSQTRSVVERTIGLLKGRWRCLDSSGGTLLYKPEKVCAIVLACAVLHNIAQLRNVPLPPDADPVGPDPDPDPDPQPMAIGPHAAAVRQRVEVMRRFQ